MVESLIARVGRLISGGVYSMVDAVENAAPDLVMEQAIREIDEATDQVREELGRAIANKHLANSRLADANKRHEELTSKIELAVGESRDDLAEAAIARQIDIEAQIPVLESAITEAAETERELEGYVSALLAKKREMQDDLAAYRKSRNVSDGSSGSTNGSAISKTDSAETKARKAEDAFDRVMERQTGSTSGVASDRKTAAQIAELEEIERRKRIQERLDAAKAKSAG